MAQGKRSPKKKQAPPLPASVVNDTSRQLDAMRERLRNSGNRSDRVKIQRNIDRLIGEMKNG